MIRVLLVDDSPIALHLLQRMLAASPGIAVVGTACNGQEALNLLPHLKPDVICTDLHMPVMDGLEFTRRVMAERPLPILVVSVSVQQNSHNVFSLLDAGALDVMSKPIGTSDEVLDEKGRELASKIRILSGVRMFKRTTPVLPEPGKPPLASALPPKPTAPPRVVVIGASTGGPQALYDILGLLPKTFPLPILCVQHIGEDFLTEMIRWLSAHAPMPIYKAAPGEMPRAGAVYFAPESAHLEIDAEGRFTLSKTPPMHGHRPSVSTTMHSAVRFYGRATVGVLLTGMGRDGADGMAAIAAAGGVTLAQDEASCVVYGMPKEAVTLGAVQHLLPLAQIAPMLMSLANRNGHA